MRALRVDKMTYAAMEVTLRAYERGLATQEVPVMRAIAMSATEISERAARFVERLLPVAAGRLDIELEDGESVIGGGSAPEVKLPTQLVSIRHSETSAAHLEEQLRRRHIPIITRTERDRVLIDLRTVAADEEPVIVEALAEAAGSNPKAASARLQTSKRYN
jgi:L-seryl-tRNA(Ser) seleniumtransferase